MDLLANPKRRKILFAVLYFSEGAPIGFLWWALPTKLRTLGYPIEQITLLTSILVIPWMFKFLWAPMIDTLRSQKWQLRSWIISSQLMMGIVIIPLALTNLDLEFTILSILLIAHAFFAATQDASIDALCISNVTPAERGSINGWMQVGMLSGRALFGGVSLIAAEKFGMQVVLFSLIFVIWLSAIFVFFVKKPAREDLFSIKIRDRINGFLKNLKEVSKNRTTWFGLFFAAVSAAGFEAVGAVAGPFMVDRDFKQEEIGLFFALPSILGMVIGALFGGYVSDKIGRIKSVKIFLISFVFVIFLIASADQFIGIVFKELIVVLLSLFYLTIGLFTASSYALFMDITNPRLGATQFSTYMGATNLCESWSAFTVGRLITSLGYPPAFFIMGLISLFTIPVINKITLKKYPE